jgi:hypothetical protein
LVNVLGFDAHPILSLEQTAFLANLLRLVRSCIVCVALLKDPSDLLLEAFEMFLGGSVSTSNNIRALHGATCALSECMLVIACDVLIVLGLLEVSQILFSRPLSK